MLPCTGLTDADLLRILLETVGTHTHTDEPSYGPPERIDTPRDPDGLEAENRWNRQQEWFEA